MADKMSELGAGVVRVPFGWDLIGRRKGCFDWRVTDAWRDEAGARIAPSSRRSHTHRRGRTAANVLLPAAQLPGLQATSSSPSSHATRTTLRSGASGTNLTLDPLHEGRRPSRTDRW